VWWDLSLIAVLSIFFAECGSESIFKIDQHLAKILSKRLAACFLKLTVHINSSISSSV